MCDDGDTASNWLVADVQHLLCFTVCVAGDHQIICECSELC